MTTAIITIAALASLAFSVALIFKFKNQPEVEAEKTEQQKNRQAALKALRDNFWGRLRRKRDSKS